MTPEDIRQRLNDSAKRINARRDLADPARRTMLARAFVEARDALTRAREEETARIEQQRKQLERKLFGSGGLTLDPQAAINRRDATAAAERIDSPAEALRIMQRAERDGDNALAKAIASKAADNSGDPVWRRIVDTYVTDKPDAADTLRAMQDLPDTSDPVWEIKQAMQYSVAAPEGLGDTSGYRVDALAALPLDGEAAA